MVGVLVVEDHLAVRMTYAEYLGASDGIEVVGAVEDGLQAVEHCRREPPDVVLMDVRMPVLDGIEATREIKAIAPRTRVILVSAYEQDELIEAGLQAGADLFLLKGVSGAELADRVLEVAAWAA